MNIGLAKKTLEEVKELPRVDSHSKPLQKNTEKRLRELGYLR
jgi:hypothetical protein